jgi:hypothetical protein
MSAIILMNADDAECAYIKDDGNGNNLVFDTAEDADAWIQEKARCGWLTRIIDLDN